MSYPRNWSSEANNTLQRIAEEIVRLCAADQSSWMNPFFNLGSHVRWDPTGGGLFPGGALEIERPDGFQVLRNEKADASRILCDFWREEFYGEHWASGRLDEKEREREVDLMMGPVTGAVLGMGGPRTTGGATACSGCGSQLSGEAKFCSQCGKKV
jgi:hypothetical protein